MSCRLCVKRGKTWEGGDPKCAFTTDTFGDNWNCATMSMLRWLCGDDSPLQIPQGLGECPVYGYRVGDSSLGVLPGPDDSFIVMSWYKNRGRVSLAFYISDDTQRPLTIQDAERAIALNVRGDSLILVDADGDPIME